MPIVRWLRFPSYIYNSSNCTGEYVPSGSSCGGKYDKCICNPDKYATTADGSGCDTGQKADTSTSCVDKTTGKTLYTCIADPCYGLADNTSELGCDKYYDQCPSKCQLGSTCKPADCSAYTLTSCPSGSTCKTCTPGCGDNAPRYKESCTPKNCSAYTLASCPAGSICGSCTPGCGDNTIKYKTFKGLAFRVSVSGGEQVRFFISDRSKTIDWGDGSSDWGKMTHTYKDAGLYDVDIYGDVYEFSTTSSAIRKIYSLNLPKATEIIFNVWSCNYMTGTIPSLPNNLTNGAKMFNGCKRLTGRIPKLPDNLTNGEQMFNGCKSLSGSIPKLPEGLINGKEMFKDCSGLSGVAPKKPASLTSYTDIFAGTKVTNDGSWPDSAW